METEGAPLLEIQQVPQQSLGSSPYLLDRLTEAHELCLTARISVKRVRDVLGPQRGGTGKCGRLWREPSQQLHSRGVETPRVDIVQHSNLLDNLIMGMQLAFLRTTSSWRWKLPVMSERPKSAI